LPWQETEKGYSSASMLATANDTRRRNKSARVQRVASLTKGKIVPHEKTADLLRAIIEPGDILCLEGDNQKQADFLASQLASLDAKDLKDLHLVMSCITLPSHIELFKKGVVRKVDFCYAGPQGNAVADLLADGKFPIGAIHTYNELYARYYLDLTPRVALIAAAKADRNGNLFLAANTEETPAIVEPTAFYDGVVIAQVNEIVDSLPRVDIPSDQVDFVIEAPYPMHLTALFTRDPAAITDVQILMAMIAIRGIYENYEVESLNHGVGFNTSAIELLLPTYGEELGLKGKICKYWMVNPLPTMIPAIESGWVKTVFSVGGEVGMERYTAARPDIYFTGRDGSFHSNRPMGQLAGHYAIDMFIGASLQIDIHGNSSTVSKNRITGFGGAPNMGCQPTGRRHPTKAWLKAGAEANPGPGALPGRKLVVQMVETFQTGRVPTFVESLDAQDPSIKAAMQGVAPVMIYGDDVTHVVTEEGIANLGACRSNEERTAAIRGVAGYTPVGLKRSMADTAALRARGIIQLPEDLGVSPARANRSLLAAQEIKDLVRWSGGLYDPPAKFVDW
jgi:malonate decarboxylase alpha subunit